MFPTEDKVCVDQDSQAVAKNQPGLLALNEIEQKSRYASNLKRTLDELSSVMLSYLIYMLEVALESKWIWMAELGYKKVIYLKKKKDDLKKS
jgi:hypothetical protein